MKIKNRYKKILIKCQFNYLVKLITYYLNNKSSIIHSQNQDYYLSNSLPMFFYTKSFTFRMQYVNNNLILAFHIYSKTNLNFFFIQNVDINELISYINSLYQINIKELNFYY